MGVRAVFHILVTHRGRKKLLGAGSSPFHWKFKSWCGIFVSLLSFIVEVGLVKLACIQDTTNPRPTHTDLIYATGQIIFYGFPLGQDEKDILPSSRKENILGSSTKQLLSKLFFSKILSWDRGKTFSQSAKYWEKKPHFKRFEKKTKDEIILWVKIVKVF